MLIGRGADASTADEDWLTQPHAAAECGHEALARLLIDRGADASAADEDGPTLLRRASGNGPGNEAVAGLPNGVPTPVPQSPTKTGRRRCMPRHGPGTRRLPGCSAIEA